MTKTDAATSDPSNPKPPALHPAYSVTNINSKIRTLDGTNVTYSAWVKLFNLHATAYKVANHIDGSLPPDITGPEHDLWKEIDALVMQWIFSTVSDPILKRIIDDTTSARMAWIKLEKLYLSNKKARAAALETRFCNLTLTACSSLDDYCQQLQSLASQLADVDHPVSASRLVLQLVRGLPQEYNTTASFINNKDADWDLAVSLLQDEQIRLDAQKGSATVLAAVSQPAPAASSADTPSSDSQQQSSGTTCTQEEVNKVMESAKSAQKLWAKTPLWKRAELLHKAAAILKDHKKPIADCLVKEIAKAAKDAATEVVRSGDLVSYCAEEGVRVLGEGKFLVSDSFPGNERTKYCLTSKIPLGVVLAIPPFNYPVNLSVSKIAPALIAGNSLVLKPPTQGAVSALHMIHCFHLAGFPKGVISCVTGKGSEIGDFLTMHPGVNCISFTGGDTGIAISKKAGMIPLQMELGGKDACIILEDADLDLASSSIVKGGFSYSGQRCTAVKVVLVMQSIADSLVTKVNEKLGKLTVGPPENNCDITPVVTESSANFIEGLVMDAKKKGATFCQEYKRKDNLIWPLLIDNVKPDMRIAWEEPFGPVLPVIRISSVEEGIHHCNASNFGLQGCIFTKDINKAILISDAMETGTVQINSAPARGPDHFPFQGLKDSGIGSQGVTNSINMMTKIKSTVINLPTPSYTMG